MSSSNPNVITKEEKEKSETSYMRVFSNLAFTLTMLLSAIIHQSIYSVVEKFRNDENLKNSSVYSKLSLYDISLAWVTIGIGAFLVVSTIIRYSYDSNSTSSATDGGNTKKKNPNRSWGQITRSLLTCAISLMTIISITMVLSPDTKFSSLSNDYIGWVQFMPWLSIIFITIEQVYSNYKLERDITESAKVYITKCDDEYAYYTQKIKENANDTAQVDLITNKKQMIENLNKKYDFCVRVRKSIKDEKAYNEIYKKKCVPGGDEYEQTKKKAEEYATFCSYLRHDCDILKASEDIIPDIKQAEKPNEPAPSVQVNVGSAALGSNTPPEASGITTNATKWGT